MLLTGWLPDLDLVLKLRGFLAKPAFKRCGRNLSIAGNVYIAFTSNVEIGRDVYIAYGAWIHGVGSIVIEDEVLLGPYVVIATGDHTMQNGGSYRFNSAMRAPIRLCKGCWVAAHATVTKGVTIGRGALLAANAVATKDIPEGCIAGGVPARILRSKTLYNENICCEDSGSD
jgi:acetyltransferase-like isoleucine patch superfamily enzyme